MRAAAVAPAAPAPERPQFVAVVTARHSQLITSFFTGKVKEVYVSSGSYVKAGAKIASIDDRELQLTLREAEAQEKAAKADAGAAGTQAGVLAKAARNEAHLMQMGASSSWAAQKAQADAAAAGSQGGAASSRAAAAHVKVEQTKEMLTHVTLTAPFAGQITQLKVGEGFQTQDGTPIARLFDTSDLVVRFAVPKEHRADVALNQRVLLKLDGVDRPIYAVIDRIDEAQEPPVDFAVVEADLDDAKLAPGEVRVTQTGTIAVAENITPALKGAKQ
ncbi:MAG TPA: HlyD family efflux transporter periplasmic adaptor subunit [Kofleriaceae bacterium]|jgi:multidrug efflux pump subunit AcrA (membrane-fusion protein)